MFEKHNKYLRLTSLLLLCPIFYFLWNKANLVRKTFFEYLLVLLLIVVVVCSQFFWNDPVKYSTIHKIDSIIAKASVVVFILYILVFKFKYSFLLVALTIVLLFCISDYYSNIEWCSDPHLISHGILHLCCTIATFYAFIP
jgi:hypothetical protein